MSWVTTACRLFQSRGPAVANDRSPTVTHRDGQTPKRLEVDERRRPRRLVGRSATYCSWSDKYWNVAPSRSPDGALKNSKAFSPAHRTTISDISRTASFLFTVEDHFDQEDRRSNYISGSSRKHVDRHSSHLRHRERDSVRARHPDVQVPDRQR